MQLSSLPTCSPAPMPGLRILIIEDDPLLGAHLSDQLDARGYQPRLCTTLESARLCQAASVSGDTSRSSFISSKRVVLTA